MINTKAVILKKLDSLPESTLEQVLDFINQLTNSSPEEDPLLSVIGILSGEPIPANQVEQELYEEQ